MKNSIVKNLIQYRSEITTQTQFSPMKISLTPGGDYIIGLEAYANNTFTTFRLVQDGKQVFPLRSKLVAGAVPGLLDNWYMIPNLDVDFAAVGYVWVGSRITDLCIPIYPDVPLTLEIGANGSAATFSVALIIANEDDTTLLKEVLERGFNRIKSLEVNK